MNHFITKCTEGHVVAQCRCPGPKMERIVDSDECPQCVEEAMAAQEWPRTTEFYTHTSKETNRDKAEELGLSEKAQEKFIYAGYELEFDIEVEEDGTAYATHFQGVKLPEKVRIT